MQELIINSRERDQLIPITGEVRRIVEASGVSQGICTVFVPHTTAGVTINENADPDVGRDLLGRLDELISWRRSEDCHVEGNSAAHLKASFFGSSVQMPISEGQLALGRWQGIYFCEFDGPRRRQVYVQIS